VHPYRIPATPPNDDVSRDASDDEPALIFALIVLGGVRVAVAFATQQPLDAEPTIALGMLVAGIAWAARRGGAHARRWWRARHANYR